MVPGIFCEVAQYSCRIALGTEDEIHFDREGGK